MISIRVGAALDASVMATFRALPAIARQARERVDDELNKLGKSTGSVYRDAPAHARKDLAKVEEVVKSTAQKTKADFAAMGSDAEKAAKKAAKAWEDSFKNVARNSVANMRGVAGIGAGVAGQFARGAGVNFDISSAIGKGVAAEKMATDITNSAFQPGAKGAAGARQDPRVLIDDVRKVAAETATDTNKALEGLQAFVGKTGDLDTGRRVLKDLAVLSRATGTELEHMVSAAADVSTALGDTENKGEKINTVMRAIAGQGKLGAVEIKDLAARMARLATSAPQFEGTVEDNIQKMGALAQLARQRGGASSAIEATGAVTSFVNTLKTPARVKSFQAEGIDVFDKKSGKMRDPFAIIRESIEKAGNDPVRLKKMFSNVKGAQGVEALAGIFREKGGGEAGMKAVDEELKKLTDAAMGQGEIAESFKRSMSTTEAKAVLFQNRLELIAASLADRVLPQLEKMAPAALQIIEAFAKLVGWAAENPGQAITLAIVGSIAKAALGNAVSSAISSLISSVAGRAAGAGVGAGGGNAIGGAMAVGAAIGTTVATVGQMKEAAAVDAAGGRQDEVQAILAKARAQRKAGAISKEDEIALQQQASVVTTTNQKIRDTEMNTGVSGFLRNMRGEISTKELGEATRDSKALPQLKAVNEAQLAALRALATSVLRVEVTNPQAIGGGGVTGRSDVLAPPP